MKDHKATIKKYQTKSQALLDNIENIQTERFELEDNIKKVIADFILVEKNIRTNPFDLDLGEWDCSNSPTNQCVYVENSSIHDEDTCIICGKTRDR